MTARADLALCSLRNWLQSGVKRAVVLGIIGCFLLKGIATSAPVISDRPFSATPIRIINTNAGRVMTANAQRYDGKVYVTGLVYRPSSPGIAPHVHVWGIDAQNHTVFFKTTSVMITGKPSFIHSESYVVSVVPSVFAKAKVIYVTFHSQSDSQANEDD